MELRVSADAIVMRSKENSYSMIRERLGRLYTDQRVEAWLDKPHDRLSQRIPRTMIESGPVEAWDVELCAEQLANLHEELAWLMKRLKEASDEFTALANSVAADKDAVPTPH